MARDRTSLRRDLLDGVLDLHAPALAIAGLLPLLVLPFAKRRYEERDRDAERARRRPRTNPAMLQGSAFVVAATAGFINGKYPLASALLVGGLAGIIGDGGRTAASPSES